MPKTIRPAQGTKPAKRPLAVGRSRVDQHARHRLVVFGAVAVNPLPDRGRRVAALDGKLTNHGMGKGVEENEANPRIADFRLQVSLLPAIACGPCRTRRKYALVVAFPFLQGLFRKLEEDALTPDLRCGNPSRGLPRQGRTLIGRQFLRRVEIPRRFKPREADQCPNFPQLLGQHDLVEESRVAVRRNHYFESEILAVQRRVRVGEDLPFGAFQVGCLLFLARRRYAASESPATLRCR